MKRSAPDPGPRAAWVFALVALVLGVGFIGFIAVGGSDRLASAPTPTPRTTATPRTTDAPSPTPALAVTGDGPGDGTQRTAEPARPTPAPAATDPGASSGPLVGSDRPLTIEFPQDGDVVVSRRINVFGRAGGGARVVRELLDGTTAGTVARPDGLWVMGVDLDPGVNQLTFRLEGADGTPVVVNVTYEPR